MVLRSPLCIFPTDKKNWRDHAIITLSHEIIPGPLSFFSLCAATLPPGLEHPPCRQWQGRLSLSVSEVLVNSMLESALCQGAFLLGDISFHEARTASPTPQPEVSGPLWPAFPHLCNLQVDQRAPFLKGHSSNRHKCWEKKKERESKKGRDCCISSKTKKLLPKIHHYFISHKERKCQSIWERRISFISWRTHPKFRYVKMWVGSYWKYGLELSKYGLSFRLPSDLEPRIIGWGWHSSSSGPTKAPVAHQGPSWEGGKRNHL